MSFLDTYSYFFFRFVFPFMVFFQFRKLLPRKIVPLVSHSIEDASTLLERAKAINIPNLDVYQDKYESLRIQFIQMRIESHRSQGFFKQLYLLFLCGLSWRLFVLKLDVDNTRRSIAKDLDDLEGAPHQSKEQSVTTPALPASAADMDHPITNVTDSTPPPK